VASDLERPESSETAATRSFLFKVKPPSKGQGMLTGKLIFQAKAGGVYMSHLPAVNAGTQGISAFLRR
ncbi:MAG: hypothetical protein ACREH3_11265, partial [Geminicoccales bacterium]